MTIGATQGRIFVVRSNFKRMRVEATMALLFRAGYMLAVLCLVTAQTNEDLDHLISQIYPETGENSTTKNPPSTGEGIILIPATTGDGESIDDTGNCSCVPYYLCKPNPIYRSSDNTCENYFHVCCVSGDIIESNPESEQPVQNLDNLMSQIYPDTKENITTNLTSSTTGDGTSNCTCVPYYLCKPNPIDRSSDNTCKNYFHVCCVSGDIIESKPESDRTVQN
ncbi:hypothetical protein CBL_09899 [Carabus blaptoides fortunei]